MTAPRDPDRLIRGVPRRGPTELPDRSMTRSETTSNTHDNGSSSARGGNPTCRISRASRSRRPLIVAVVFGASRLLPGTPGDRPGGPGPSASASLVQSFGVADGRSPRSRRTLAAPLDPCRRRAVPGSSRIHGDDRFRTVGGYRQRREGLVQGVCGPPTRTRGDGLDRGQRAGRPVRPVDIDPPLGPSVNDLADVLASQPYTVLHEDSPVTLDGYRGRYLDYTADPTKCFSMERWTSDGGIRQALDGERDRVWILDVEGARSSWTPSISRRHRTPTALLLRTIVESVQIRPWNRP